MAINKIEIQNSTGDIYYPHTSSDVVKHGNSTLSAFLTLLENKFKSYLPLAGGTMTGNLVMSNSSKVVGNVQGNADTATRLQNSRNITIGKSTQSFNGSGNISYTLPQVGAVQFEYSANSVVNGGRIPTIFADNSEWFMTRSGGIVPHINEGGYLGVPTRKFYDVNTVHINALHVGGHANNQRWELIPVVNNQGVMEIGRYIDFHNVKSSVSDYTFRFDNHSPNSCVYYGTLAQHSDRRLKENIEYIDDIQMLSNLKIKKEEYKFKDFIKEIRFATFKYKGSKENTFGFIAQDLENFEVADYMLKDITSEAVNDIDADENGQATYKSFDTMAYASVIAKALQEEIKFRDKQIESLEEKIKLLEKKIDALAS